MYYSDCLTTDRLITRFLVYEDYYAIANFFSDRETRRFITLTNETDDNTIAIKWINKQLARYANNQYGLQALVNKTTGEFVGQCGLVTQIIDEMSELEIGYHIFPKFRGQGYATEAAVKFKHYAFENNLASSVISIIHKNNIASQRVAEKNGMEREKATKFQGAEVYVYRVTNKV
jgi:RimJ/RimL family protein N-acetyltransferase